MCDTQHRAVTAKSATSKLSGCQQVCNEGGKLMRQQRESRTIVVLVVHPGLALLAVAVCLPGSLHTAETGATQYYCEFEGNSLFA
jgi:hypothetical protein